MSYEEIDRLLTRMKEQKERENAAIEEARRANR
jgi:hypothetical protein